MNPVAIFGATSAIAQAFARRLAWKGARLFLVGRRQAHLDEIAADLSVLGAVEVAVRLADLADRAVQAEIVEASFAAFGGLDGVLLAYGSFPDQAAAISDGDIAAEAIAVNFCERSHAAYAHRQSHGASGGGHDRRDRLRRRRPRGRATTSMAAPRPALPPLRKGFAIVCGLAAFRSSSSSLASSTRR